MLLSQTSEKIVDDIMVHGGIQIFKGDSRKWWFSQIVEASPNGYGMIRKWSEVVLMQFWNENLTTKSSSFSILRVSRVEAWLSVNRPLGIRNPWVRELPFPWVIAPECLKLPFNEPLPSCVRNFHPAAQLSALTQFSAPLPEWAWNFLGAILWRRNLHSTNHIKHTW